MQKHIIFILQSDVVGVRAMKKILISFLCIILLGLSGCSTQSSQKNVQVRIPTLKNNEIYLVKHHELITYDMQQKRDTYFSVRKDQYSYYSFGGDSSLYTAGDAEELGFAVFDITEKEVKEIKKMPDNEDLLPLAYDVQEDQYFFVNGKTSDVSEYKKTGLMDENVIVQYDGSTWRELKNTKIENHNILTGVFFDGFLYYVVVDTLNADNQLDLYRINIRGNDLHPHIVRTNLYSDILLSYNGALLLEEKEEIVKYGEHNFPCLTSEDCWIIESRGLFLSLTNNGTLRIYDIVSGAVLATLPDFLTYRMKNDKLIIYCDGVVKEY
ncbi:MAG: hypothetical protein J6M18_00900 [Actinomycetaceae bacterium]|nr:hypothetical protein [Actinomycetaceae bacterium]